MREVEKSQDDGKRSIHQNYKFSFWLRQPWRFEFQLEEEERGYGKINRGNRYKRTNKPNFVPTLSSKPTRQLAILLSPLGQL
jgi:hypothetical protein